MILQQPINKLIVEFISEMDAKPYVQKNTQWVLQRFVTWMVRNRVNVKQPRKADLLFYKASLINEGCKPTTINRYLSPLRNFFEWLEQRNQYTNITLGIKRVKDDRRFRKEYLQPQQVAKLLRSIPINTLAGLRDYAMINLMIHAGLRRVEIYRLTLAHLDGNVLTIQRKAREYTEQLRLEPEVVEPITNYLAQRCPSDINEPMFSNHSPHRTAHLSITSISKIVKRYLVQISESKQLTCHSLRHTGAITLLRAGKSLYDVQQFLGHSTIKSTEPYLKAIEAEQRFNNPLSRDLIDSFKYSNKTANTE